MKMAELIKNTAQVIIGEKCYDTYFVDHDFLDGGCFKVLLSKGLGYTIIAGSMLVKVPQVLKLLKNKSGEGINMISVLLELVAITLHMSYSFMSGYPFSAWGDSSFLALQTAAIGALVLYYSGSKGASVAFFLGYLVYVYVLNSGLVPLLWLRFAQGLNIPIVLAGKLSQAFTNYKNGSTGQLAAATVFMLLGGSLARIFTSVQETGDFIVIVTFCASTFANAVIAAQMVYYWNKSGKGKKVKVGQAEKNTKAATAKKPRSKKID